jgi:hypothetical protein
MRAAELLVGGEGAVGFACGAAPLSAAGSEPAPPATCVGGLAVGAEGGGTTLELVRTACGGPEFAVGLAAGGVDSAQPIAIKAINRTRFDRIGQPPSFQSSFQFLDGDVAELD